MLKPGGRRVEPFKMEQNANSDPSLEGKPHQSPLWGIPVVISFFKEAPLLRTARFINPGSNHKQREVGSLSKAKQAPEHQHETHGDAFTPSRPGEPRPGASHNIPGRFAGHLWLLCFIGPLIMLSEPGCLWRSPGLKVRGLGLSGLG